MNLTDEQKVMYLTRPSDEPPDMTPEQVMAQAKALQLALGLDG